MKDESRATNDEPWAKQQLLVGALSTQPTERRDLHYDLAVLPVTFSTLWPHEVAQSRRKTSMKKRRILLALLGILVGWGGAGMAQANPWAE